MSYKAKDWLQNEYVLNKKSAKQIADQCNVKESTINKWIHKHGIKKPNDAMYTNRDWLYQEYIVKDRSQVDIGNECGVNSTAILKWLRKFKIQKEQQYKSYQDRDWLFQEYVIKKRTQKDIALEAGITVGSLKQWLQKHGLTTKFFSDAPYTKKEWLYTEYIVKNRTAEDIAQEFNVSRITVEYWRRVFDIDPHPLKRETKPVEMITIVCDLCGEFSEKDVVYVNRSIRQGRKIYCSQSCADNAHRHRMAGESNPNHGGTWHGQSINDMPDEIRRIAIRKGITTRTRNGSMMGSNNPRWNGGSKTVNCLMCGVEYEVRPYAYNEMLSGKRVPLHDRNCKRMYALTVMPREKTSIEIKVRDELERRGVFFIEQFNLDNYFALDFYLPQYAIAIECDGDYWHNLPEVKRRDRIKNGYVKRRNIHLLRFWEHEINDDVISCVDQVVKAIESRVIPTA